MILIKLAKAPKLNRKVKMEVKAKSSGEHNLLEPFATVHTCRQSSTRQHRPTTEVAIKRDDNPILGRRRASGLNLKIYSERTSDLVLEGIILNFPPNMFDLSRTSRNENPENVGADVVVRLLAGGGLCGCVDVLAVD